MSRNLNPPAIVKAAEDIDAVYINAEHEAGQGATRKGLEHYRNAGLRLLAKKANLKHGEWLPWAKAKLLCTERQAQRYMELAKSDAASDLAEAWCRISGHATSSEEANAEEETAAGIFNVCEDEEDTEDDTPSFGSDAALADDLFHSDQQEPLRQELPLAGESPAKGGYFTVDQWAEMSASGRKKMLREAIGDTKFNAQKNDSIEWALWSWNPVTGCLHNCPYCYARDIATNGPTAHAFPNGFTPTLIPSRLKAPHNTVLPRDEIDRLKRSTSTEDRARALGLGNVFTCSMADLFGRWVPREWIDAVLAEVRAASQWTFLFLTKFPVRMAEFDFPNNAWVGTTVDCQARVANAERSFRKVKAGVKWLSIEPLIEPLKFADLGAFNWVVIGGASRSAQTPEWMPPDSWVSALKVESYRLGVKVYEKSNIRRDRVRQYPGVQQEQEACEAPAALRYLPTPETTHED